MVKILLKYHTSCQLVPNSAEQAACDVVGEVEHKSEQKTVGSVSFVLSVENTDSVVENVLADGAGSVEADAVVGIAEDEVTKHFS